MKKKKKNYKTKKKNKKRKIYTIFSIQNPYSIEEEEEGVGSVRGLQQMRETEGSQGREIERS